MKELQSWSGRCNQLNHYAPGLAREQATLRNILKKDTPFIVTAKMSEEFEAAKEAIGRNILQNSFDVNRETLVNTDATGDGFGHILLQKKNGTMVISGGSSIKKGAMREDTSWVFIQVRSVALKHLWWSYPALELEGVCIIWTLKTLSYYFKGCLRFQLWSDHSPLAQSMKKGLRSLSPRMQHFRKAIEAYNVDISFARGIHNQITALKSACGKI